MRSCKKILSFLPILVILLFSFTPNLSPAKSASYNILKQSIAELKNQNQLLQEKLNTHAKDVVHQNQQIQQLRTAIIQDQQQTNNTEASADLYINLFRLLTLLTLTLIIGVFYWLSKKYLPLLKEHKTTLKKLGQHQQEIDELKQKSLLLLKGTKAIEQKVTSSSAQSNQKINNLQQDIEAIHQEEKVSKDQIATDLHSLDKLLKTPLMHGLSRQDISTIESLLEANQLDFISSVKAKALIKEHEGKWQYSIKYWDTVLIEQPKHNEALLHIGFANFKLAAEHRKDESYLNTAVDYYDQIMVSAPEYFEDAYGFDDQTIGPDEINTNPDELWLYQQVEKLIIKTDELRNYHAILNIACEYSAAGNIENARECLEQISSIYHAHNYKQLQVDKDLESIRDQDWFKKIIKEASEVNLAEYK